MATYKISGMSCGNCVAKIKKTVEDIAGADVTLNPPQLIVPDTVDIGYDALSLRVKSAGEKYSLFPVDAASSPFAAWLKTYRPLFLIIAYISVASFAGAAGAYDWMLNFMAGFFLVFSFFKFLDLRGFAQAYAGYDLLAKKEPRYGLIYPFIELALGLSYLFRVNLTLTLIVTLVLMSFSSIGVIQAVMNKQKIRCACLGTSLNLPMSTITIVEDIGMALMALAMIFVAH